MGPPRLPSAPRPARNFTGHQEFQAWTGRDGRLDPADAANEAASSTGIVVARRTFGSGFTGTLNASGLRP